MLLRKQSPCLGKQPFGGARQTDPTRRPIEQADAEFAFQPSDLLAHRRLDDVQAFGGKGETALLGDRDKVPKLPYLHWSYNDR
ncbi:hypothetical protein GCM10029978_064090 [Actinoallomurus acanthiterrae]